MPDRILLDANALLNAVFVPFSWSRLAINLALRNGATLYIGYRSLREASDTALKFARELRKRTDPRTHIERQIQQARIREVHPDRACTIPIQIPHHDAHVVQEASSARAEILTSDSELWLACKEVGVLTVLPLELIRRYDGPSLESTIFGVPPKRDSGAIFARAYPGNWAGLEIDERFTIIDTPGVLWIYYSASEKKWTVDLDEHGRMEIAAPISEQQLIQTIALSWRQGEMTFRVAGVEHPERKVLDRPLGRPTSPNGTIGSHRSGQHFWNGPIYLCITNDQPISRTGWTNIRQHRDLTPNPFDSDRLREAIGLMLR